MKKTWVTNIQIVTTETERDAEDGDSDGEGTNEEDSSSGSDSESETEGKQPRGARSRRLPKGLRPFPYDLRTISRVPIDVKAVLARGPCD